MDKNLTLEKLLSLPNYHIINEQKSKRPIIMVKIYDIKINMPPKSGNELQNEIILLTCITDNYLKSQRLINFVKI